jgi:hypothetical protein
MNDSNIIEIYADYIYYAIAGDKENIDELANLLNKTNIENYIEYFSFKTIVPLAKQKSILEKNKKINIKLETIVEEAQAHTYYNYTFSDSYILVCLKKINNKYILTFPRFIMVDGDNPERGLIDEFKRLTNNKLNPMVENTIKPIAIMGKNKNTVLYFSYLTNKNYQDEFSFSNLLKLLETLTIGEGDGNTDE